MKDKPYWRLLLPRWLDLRIPRKIQSKDRIESNIAKLKAMLEEEESGRR